MKFLRLLFFITLINILRRLLSPLSKNIRSAALNVLQGTCPIALFVVSHYRSNGTNVSPDKDVSRKLFCPTFKVFSYSEFLQSECVNIFFTLTLNNENKNVYAYRLKRKLPHRVTAPLPRPSHLPPPFLSALQPKL